MLQRSDELPSNDPWRWKLRLFASADLVGSTAFKASRTDWAPTFKEFFSEFPAAVDVAYSNSPLGSKGCTERLQPWKFSGDEVLFWAELKDHRDSIVHISALKRAVDTFPDKWKAKRLPLRLKATAWLAGFPVTNTEIVITNGQSGRESLDFIGPSIDLGFRIAKFCDERRFVLSADLALMLLDAVDTCEVKRELFHIHLHGREPLKGVIGNEPYPILWLDMRDGDPVLEERLLGVRRDFRSDDLKDYLRQLLDDNPKLRRPFIDGDKSDRYGREDADIAKAREMMRAEESIRNYQQSGKEEPPINGEARQPRDPPTGLSLGYF